MKAARIFVLGVALAAGGIAAYLVGPGVEKKPQAPVAKSIISAPSLTIQSLFDGFAGRKTALGPAIASTNA